MDVAGFLSKLRGTWFKELDFLLPKLRSARVGLEPGFSLLAFIDLNKWLQFSVGAPVYACTADPPTP